jgi:2-amino-4-hydroxy-6-hydroxymethyldihydropteridine diphosphokinase
MNRVYLGIGGNMGDRWQALQLSIDWIHRCIGAIIIQSSVYETKAWGETNQNNFYNQVVYLETKMGALPLLSACQQIEQEMGRIKSKKWGERMIDIDILFFNEDIFNDVHCTIPHPYLHLRKFVLIPLQEIAPTFMHPLLNKNINELLQNCTDDLDVKIV